jgi:Flp pilus assembly protein TadB
MTSPFFISLLAAFATYFSFVGIWRRKQAASRVEAFRQRLREFQAQSAMGGNVMEDSAVGSTARKSDFLSRMGEQLTVAAFSGAGGRSLMDAIEDRLMLAGYPRGWHAPDYIAFCTIAIGSAVLGGGMLVQLGIPSVLYLGMVALTAAYCWYELQAQINRRQQQAFFELPYFLDEIIMSLSSGASTLDQALREVVTNDMRAGGMREKEKVLVQEFRRAYQEAASQARPFSEAFRAAADRIQVQPVTDLVETLVEGQQSGAPILPILRDMSQHVYSIFEQEMETLIKKKDSTFTIATVIMMAGSALVIIIPIMLTVLKALSGGV